jgi:hypothetical protein
MTDQFRGDLPEQHTSDRPSGRPPPSSCFSSFDAASFAAAQQLQREEERERPFHCRHVPSDRRGSILSFLL